MTIQKPDGQIELLPCPFCGKAPTIDSSILAYIGCDDCGFQMTAYQTGMSFLIDKWNRRFTANAVQDLKKETK